MKVIAYGGYSHVGKVRSENQDFYGRFPEDHRDSSGAETELFLVADGMGGHRGGREASRLAVETINEIFFSDPHEEVDVRLEAAFREANDRIYQASLDYPQLSGMGTTCTAFVVRESRGYVAHIGDSRLYRINGRGIAQLTKDHSRVAEMERRGLLTKEEARYHPERSTLYRALGTRPDAEVDFLTIDLLPDEHFILCTDGLSSHVDEKEIRAAILSNPPQQACEKLTAIANERGGQDNITVQVIHIDNSHD